MKKILCLLTLITAMGCSVIAHANTPLNDALEYLDASGISLEYEEETIQPDSRITRANFVELIVKLLNIDDVTCEKAYYHDVSVDHWAFNKIGILTENGILSGGQDQHFRPDEYITRDEAATILVSALGYRVEAEGIGNWPEGYLRTASSLELFEDTSYSKEITLSDAIIMMRNALDVNMLKIIFQESDMGYTKSDKVTLLSYYHDKYYNKGILEGCDGVDIASGNSIKEGYVIIDGVEYVTDLTDLINNIGTKVEFMYEINEKTDEKRIVWLKSLGHSDSVEFVKDEYDYYSPALSEFCYVPDGKEALKKLKLSRGLIIIYNGAIAQGSYDSILNSDKYTVRFIKSHTSSEYDIAIIWKYETMVVGRVDIGQEVIYNKFVQGDVLDISSTRDRITVTGGGNLSQIVEGDTISYYESEDSKLLRIDVSKNVKEVTAKYISMEDDSLTLFAEDGKYVFYDNNASFSVTYGESVRLYIDICGYVVYVDHVKVDGFPVYLISARYSEDDEVLFIKALDYDGNIVKRNVPEKALIDGSKKKQEEIFDILAPGGTTVQQVLIIETDENNVITSIDTTEIGLGETDDNSLTKVESNYSGFYKHHGAFFPKYIFASDAVIFYPPLTETDKADERNYIVKSRSDLHNNESYTADIYRYSKDTGYVDLAVLKAGRVGASSDRIYLLVDEIKNSINEDGDIVEKLICTYQGSKAEYLTTDDFSLRDAGVIPGDVIAITRNTSGKIKAVQRKYEYDGAFTTQKVSSPQPDTGFAKGYVHSVVGNILRVRYDGTDFESAFVMPENVIIVYDTKEREHIRKGTMWDFTPGAKIVFQTMDENPIMMVIYK